MNIPAKSLLKRLVLLACLLSVAPAAEAQAWSDGPAANPVNSRIASLPAARYGLMAPASVNNLPSGNSSTTNFGGYALPSGGLPYSATSAMSINVCDDEPVIQPEAIEPIDENDSEVYYPAPRTQGGVK